MPCSARCRYVPVGQPALTSGSVLNKAFLLGAHMVLSSDKLEEIKEVLNYCPSTGHFNWAAGGKGKRRESRRAGYYDDSGYLRVKVLGKAYLAHRLAWAIANGKWPVGDIDHINRVRDDNRLSNIRDVSRADNLHNNNLHEKLGTSSGVAGVSKSNLLWHAKISINNKTVCLGRYTTVNQAHQVYLTAKANRLAGRPLKEITC